MFLTPWIFAAIIISSFGEKKLYMENETTITEGVTDTAGLEPSSTVDYAAMFKALGDPTRLRIFEMLRSACCAVAVDDAGNISQMKGPTAGEICCQITGKERVTSTISEHLKELRVAKLIVMERHGKNMICAVNPLAPILLAQFFAEESNTQPMAGASLASPITLVMKGQNDECC